MNIDRIIQDLPKLSNKELRDLENRAARVPMRHNSYADAVRLLSEVEAEQAQRRKLNRMKVGQLWWEPHDPYVAEFHGHTNPDDASPVATIFKANTHTATRKGVYSVRIGDYAVLGPFSEVALARRAGSDAWEERQKQISSDVRRQDLGKENG